MASKTLPSKEMHSGSLVHRLRNQQMSRIYICEDRGGQERNQSAPQNDKLSTEPSVYGIDLLPKVTFLFCLPSL